MFKNKYLKQLQEIQAQIKTCTANINNLKPPAPSSVAVERDMLGWLDAIVYGHDPSIGSILENNRRSSRDDTLDYMRKLGEYLINTADYCKADRTYKAELAWLRTEERRLKDKLGID